MSEHKSLARRIEEGLETVLFASRWLLAPFYLGLAFSLIVLLIKFVAELFHIAAHAFTASESEVILGVLALVDLALTGSLLVIVIFSGYENFVSRIDHGDHQDWPEWMGKIDFSGLKLKLLSSIVAISAIQLLKQFMTINSVSDRDVMWLVIIHVVFVVSSVFLALSDRIAGHDSGDGGSGNHGGHGSGDTGEKAGKAATGGGGKPAAGHGAAGNGVAGQGNSGKSAATQAAAPKPDKAPARSGPIVIETTASSESAHDLLDEFPEPAPRGPKRTLN